VTHDRHSLLAYFVPIRRIGIRQIGIRRNGIRRNGIRQNGVEPSKGNVGISFDVIFRSYVQV